MCRRPGRRVARGRRRRGQAAGSRGEGRWGGERATCRRRDFRAGGWALNERRSHVEIQTDKSRPLNQREGVTILTKKRHALRAPSMPVDLMEILQKSPLSLEQTAPSSPRQPTAWAVGRMLQHMSTARPPRCSSSGEKQRRRWICCAPAPDLMPPRGGVASGVAGRRCLLELRRLR
jgi:hypothetical protein